MTDPLTPRLILASASPRRAELLRGAGIPFTLAPISWEEPPPTEEDEGSPSVYVERMAERKAQAAVEALAPSAEQILILAADTIVCHAGRILTKPRDAEEARTMLKSLRGDTHRVFTGVCLLSGERRWLNHDVTSVTFYHVSDRWIERYVASGEPMDKAGAYAAQGLGAFLIKGVEGDYSNVVGLPLGMLGRMLEQAGAPVEMWWDQESQV